MLMAFLKTYWGASLISLGTLCVQSFLPRTEVTLILLVLNTLAWGIPLARLWSQTQTTLAGRERLPESYDAPPQDVSQLLAEIRSTVQAEVQRIDTSLSQAQGLLRNAVGGLSQSFHGLDSQTQTQQQLVVSLLGDMSGAATTTHSSYLTMQEFTESISAALQYFIDLVINISTQSVKTAYKIDDMARQLDGLFASLTNIKAITDDTHLLAQIEEIKTTIAVVRKVVDTVASTDMNVSLEAKGRVDLMLLELNKANECTALSLQEVSTVTGQIHADIGVAMHALQFEGIFTQLLGYTRQPLDTLQGLATALEAAAEADGSTQRLSLGVALTQLHAEVHVEDHTPVA